jgi:hypothetical protein
MVDRQVTSLPKCPYAKHAIAINTYISHVKNESDSTDPIGVVRKPLRERSYVRHARMLLPVKPR